MKIEVKIEGEDFGELIRDIENIVENNREKIKRLLRFFAKETIEVLEDNVILDKGAELYIKLNRAINYRYKKKNRKKE